MNLAHKKNRFNLIVKTVINYKKNKTQSGSKG